MLRQRHGQACSHRVSQSPITENAFLSSASVWVLCGSAAATAGDRADAETFRDLKHRLLTSAGVLARLAELALLGRDDPARAQGISRLVDELEHHLSPRDIDLAAERLTCDQPPVANVVGFTGKVVKGARPRAPETVALVARSLELRVEGLGITEADERTADEVRARGQAPDLSTEAIAIYRLRLRQSREAALLDE
jgi:hypothetical protein